MVTFSKEELNYIASQTLPYLLEMARSSSLEIDDVDIIDDYSGITSMPAYDNGGGLKRIVRVPLSVFAKPAEDAVAEVSDAIEQALEATEKATQFVEEAETLRNDIAKALTDAQDSVIIAQTALEQTNQKLEGLDDSVEAANTAASSANTAATNAQSVADHPTYIGSDYYVYQWDYSQKSYVKSDTYVKGENGETPIFQQGTTTTLNPSDSAEVKVTQIGTSSDGNPIYRLDFSIPKGQKGENGSGSGNVLVDESNLVSSKTYLFKPRQNGSAEGSFVEYEIPDIDTSTLVTDSELTEALKGKQNVIDDLDIIRANASSALKEIPEGYVTEDDLDKKDYATNESVNERIGAIEIPDIPNDYLGCEDVGEQIDDSVEYLTTSHQSLSEDEKERVKSNIGVNIPIVDHGVNDSTFALTPNKYHRWGAMTSLTLTLSSPNDTSVVNNYAFEFTSGETPTTLLVPSDIQWVNDVNIEANMRYQGIINSGIGVLVSVTNE